MKFVAWVNASRNWTWTTQVHWALMSLCHYLSFNRILWYNVLLIYLMLMEMGRLILKVRLLFVWICLCVEWPNSVWACFQNLYRVSLNSVSKVINYQNCALRSEFTTWIMMGIFQMGNCSRYVTLCFCSKLFRAFVILCSDWWFTLRNRRTYIIWQVVVCNQSYFERKLLAHEFNLTKITPCAFF